MSQNKLYKVSCSLGTISPIEPTTCKALNLDANDIMKWVESSPYLIDDKVLIIHRITGEFKGGEMPFYKNTSTNRSEQGTGLLALDDNGDVCLIFNAVDLKCVKEACVALKWSHYAKYLNEKEVLSLFHNYLGDDYSVDDAREAICSFLGDSEFASGRKFVTSYRSRPDLYLIAESVSKDVSDFLESSSWDNVRIRCRRVIAHSLGEEVYCTMQSEYGTDNLVPDLTFRDPYTDHPKPHKDEWKEMIELSQPPTMVEMFWRKFIKEGRDSLGSLLSHACAENCNTVESFSTDCRLYFEIKILEKEVHINVDVRLNKGEPKVLELLHQRERELDSMLNVTVPKAPNQWSKIKPLASSKTSLSIYDEANWEVICDWLIKRIATLLKLDEEIENL